MEMAPITIIKHDKFIRVNGKKICGMEEEVTISSQDKSRLMELGNVGFLTDMQKLYITMVIVLLVTLKMA